MMDLKFFIKDKLPIFVVCCFGLIYGIIFSPICLNTLYEFFSSGNSSISISRVIGSLGTVILFIPALYFGIGPRIIQYLSALLDLKKQTKITITVSGLEKPVTEAFDRYPEFYYVWKTQDKRNKKYKFLIFKDKNTLKGKTKKNYYDVTFYKYSKIVTLIEKQSD